jgi:hypothetical protein
MPFKKKSEDKKVEVAPAVTPQNALPASSITPAIKLPKAFYIEKEKGVWRLITADVDGDKLVNKKVKECDNKALSLENFKIMFAKFYYFGR